MFLWNEISYDKQQKVLDLIEDLLLRQTDEEMQYGLAAALSELEIWSNTPCTITDDDGYGVYVAEAVDQSAGIE